MAGLDPRLSGTLFAVSSCELFSSLFVMTGLDPAIHGLFRRTAACSRRAARLFNDRKRNPVDGRIKPAMTEECKKG
jgi:hypothetical protein